MSSGTEIWYGFFCEFARPEANGATTAIGICGAELKFPAKGPFLLPSLAFHAYIFNPDHIDIFGKITMDVPGLPQKPEAILNIKYQDGIAGHNINMALQNIPIQGPCKISCHLSLQTDPPIEKDFHLNIKFVDSVKTPISIH